MRIFGCFQIESQMPFHGELSADGNSVRPLRAAPWLGGMQDAAGESLPLAALTILSPVAPGKLLAVGRNYAAHAAEHGQDVPKSPLTWLKSPGSLLAHKGTIELPYPQHQVDFEAELAVVIGRRAKNVSLEDAGEYIFGYLPSMDISDRDIQKAEGQYYRAKSFDTFTPVGPYIYCGGDVDDGNLAVTLHCNGKLRQDGHTSQMIFSVREIISFASQGTTLLPGDVILTGTPAGVGPIQDGDTLEVRVGSFAPLIAKVRNAE